MDYLQYRDICDKILEFSYRCSFKPCYKWITFNTKIEEILDGDNLEGFKPCYKWITFNTETLAASYDLFSEF